MSKLTIYKSPIKALKLIGLSTPFVAIGAWSIKDGYNSGTGTFMGWIAIIFFGSGVIIGIILLFDRRVQIRIDENGVWDRTTKMDTIPWEMIKEAYPIDISGQGFVSLVLEESFEAEVERQKWATTLNQEIGAQKVNIHVGHTKAKAGKIAELINRLIQTDKHNRVGLIKNVAQQYL